MKQPLADLMQRIDQVGPTERHKREIACRDRGKHNRHLMDVSGGIAFAFCDDCLVLFIQDILVNSTLAKEERLE